MKLFNVMVSAFRKCGNTKQTYRTTLDDNFILSDIPEAFPELNADYCVATDLKTFTVIEIDSDRSTVLVMEKESGLEYEVSLDAFDLLFVNQAVSQPL